MKFIARESKNSNVINNIVRDPDNNWWLYSINTSNEEVQIKRKNAKYFPHTRNKQPRLRFSSPPWNGYHSEIRYAGTGWPIHCSKNVNYLSHYENQYEGKKKAYGAGAEIPRLTAMTHGGSQHRFQQKQCNILTLGNRDKGHIHAGKPFTHKINCTEV